MPQSLMPSGGNGLIRLRQQTLRRLLDALDANRSAGDRVNSDEELQRLVRRGTQSAKVICRNDSDSIVPFGGVLGIEGTLLPRSDNKFAWPGDLALKGQRPRKHHRSFVVATEPILPGYTGECVIEGVCAVQVEYRSSSHGFADPVIDESGWLQTSTTGWARLYEVDDTERLNLDKDQNDEFVDEFPRHWALAYLNPLVNGHPIGEVIRGQVVSEMSAASWRSIRNGPSVARRDSTVALMRLYDVDHDNELFDQARFRYDVLDYIPFDQDAADAGNAHNEIVIGYDLRNGSFIQEHWPLWIIDSTGRDGVWTVDKDWANDVRWDAAAKRYRIPIKEKIPSVLDPDELPNEVQKIDGDLILPGADMLKGTDRYELVVNRRGFSAALNAWATAIWTGTEYEVIAVSC